ncbi:MAG TPA: bifunctional nuclease family protein [Pseudonocardia sp.]|jgi:bifunctional DNase/RNase|nr:bifunctional nuclease family protein [Pseudonocardia sp.]
MQEMSVAAVGLDAATSTPVVLLQEVAPRHRMLPVWVGVAEAEAIEIERQQLRLPRPPAHHLIAEVIDFCGRRLEHVCVTAVRDGVVHAELVIDRGLHVSARVSDAVAVALHVGAPIMATDTVLDEAALEGVRMVEASESAAPGGPADGLPDERTAVAELREFLDHATPDDFS